jgi:hypothetical protein
MSDIIQVKDWQRLQHYKKSKPPWIKLYRDILGDYEFGKLSTTNRWTLIGLWLLAAETNNKIPLDEEWIKARLNLTEKPDLSALQELGFISLGEQPRLNLDGDYSQKRREEKRREEREALEMEVFDYWQERRREVLSTNGRPPMKPTEKRMGKIRGRLKEGYTVESLKKAVDGCLGNDFNVQGSFVDIELICRDQKHVEQYMDWAEKNKPKSQYNPISDY